MSISDIVTMALTKGNKAKLDLVGVLGVSSRNAVYNKFGRESWSAEDLARVADFTGGKLMIVYPDGQQILIPPPPIVMSDADAKSLIQAHEEAKTE